MDEEYLPIATKTALVANGVIVNLEPAQAPGMGIKQQ